MLANESALVNIASQQANQGSQLFQTAFPGVQQAENFYGTLASGDPYAIARAISPAVKQVNEATAGAKQNILTNAPAGGEKNLAIEQADVAQAGKISDLATGGFLNSFNALGALGGQNIGQSISSANTAVSGLGSANQALGNLGNLQLQQYQIQQQAKGSTLGALSSLGAGIFEGAGAAGSLGALFAL